MLTLKAHVLSLRNGEYNLNLLGKILKLALPVSEKPKTGENPNP
jgi:hypothetical protein